MADAVAVDERVAADHRRDQEAERRAAPTCGSAHQQHAGGDDEHAGDLGRRGIRADDRHGEDERRDRREPARDRVDDRELEPPIRRREQRDVDELERARRNDVLPGARRRRPTSRRRTARARATNATTETAVAASASRVPRRSRFQTAWRVAAPSASRSAAAPTGYRPAARPLDGSSVATRRLPPDS